MMAYPTKTRVCRTVSVSVSGLFQVVGMHFFSPTHIMRLVECVKGTKTDPSTLATIADMSKKMKKVWRGGLLI